MLVLDIKDRTAPKLIATYDYVPPYHGGFLGAAHTAMPVVTQPGEHPDLVVHTDEIFDCPQGFGRILDVSDLKNPEVVKGERPANVQLLSTFRASHVQDRFDPQKKEFVCPGKGRAARHAVQHHPSAVAGPALAEPGLRHLVRRGRARHRHLQSVRPASSSGITCRRASPRRAGSTATRARSSRIPTPVSSI